MIAKQCNVAFLIERRHSHFIEPLLDLSPALGIREVLNNNYFKLLKTGEVLPEREDYPA